MNSYIKAQCQQITSTVQMFNNVCKMAAMKDDGELSNKEKKELKRIEKATLQFTSEIQKIIE